MIELLVVLAIASLVFGAGLSLIHSSIRDLDLTARGLAATLRSARAHAIANGVHYRFIAGGARDYRIERCREESGAWVAERAITTARLPLGIRFADPLVGVARFDSRGMLAEPAATTTIAVSDPSGRVETIDIWRSGQILAR